jgi:hypothetical protein
MDRADKHSYPDLLKTEKKHGINHPNWVQRKRSIGTKILLNTHPLISRVSPARWCASSEGLVFLFCDRNQLASREDKRRFVINGPPDDQIPPHGCADAYAYGMGDVESKLPIGRDTICRIYSQSKIVSTVAALTLVEEGKIDLGDPVENYLPLLANRQVMIGGTPDKPKLETASHPFTVRELMTHTAGFIYGFAGTDAVHELWKRAHLGESKSLTEFVERLAPLPLARDPGTTFEYAVSIDALGAVVEKASGQPFERFFCVSGFLNRWG